MQEIKFHIMLNQLLNESGLKQNALAKEIGVKAPAMNNYLQGKYLPQITKIIKITEVLGKKLNRPITLDYILTGKKTEKLKYHELEQFIKENVIKDDYAPYGTDFEILEVQQKYPDLYEHFKAFIKACYKQDWDKVADLLYEIPNEYVKNKVFVRLLKEQTERQEKLVKT